MPKRCSAGHPARDPCRCPACRVAVAAGAVFTPHPFRYVLSTLLLGPPLRTVPNHCSTSIRTPTDWGAPPLSFCRIPPLPPRRLPRQLPPPAHGRRNHARPNAIVFVATLPSFAARPVRAAPLPAGGRPALGGPSCACLPDRPALRGAIFAPGAPHSTAPVSACFVVAALVPLPAPLPFVSAPSPRPLLSLALGVSLLFPCAAAGPQHALFPGAASLSPPHLGCLGRSAGPQFFQCPHCHLALCPLTRVS